jgi:hypothetical protein
LSGPFKTSQTIESTKSTRDLACSHMINYTLNKLRERKSKVFKEYNFKTVTFTLQNEVPQEKEN